MLLVSSLIVHHINKLLSFYSLPLTGVLYAAANTNITRSLSQFPSSWLRWDLFSVIVLLLWSDRLSGSLMSPCHSLCCIEKWPRGSKHDSAAGNSWGLPSFSSATGHISVSPRRILSGFVLLYLEGRPSSLFPLNNNPTGASSSLPPACSLSFYPFFPAGVVLMSFNPP